MVAGVALTLLAVSAVLHGARDYGPAQLTAPAADGGATVPQAYSLAMLDAMFGHVGYDLERVRAGAQAVPRLHLAGVPEGLDELSGADERKAAFIAFMLPLVLQANERVLDQRRFLESLIAEMDAETLSEAAAFRLLAIAAEYQLPPHDLAGLLERVDVVPPALALAQAAIESGWGTSRFVREGNAAYGQYTTVDYDGLIPAARAEGATFKVRAFDSLIDSVDSYLRNLNTHPAYRDFRALRTALRTIGEPLDGSALAGTLEGYSEKGQRYVALVREVIHLNGLEAFNAAQLGTEVVPPPDFRVAYQPSGT